MSTKGQVKFDEFSWIIIGAVGFVLLMTIIFTSTTSKPVLQPNTIQLTLTNGSSSSFVLTVSSADGRKMTNVTLTGQGEIQSWLSFDRTNFDVDNSTTVLVRVNVPTSADYRTWNGNIQAQTTGGSSSIPVAILVTNISNLTFNTRPISLGNFQITYTKGSETISTQNDIQISKGVFADSKDTFPVVVSPDKLSVTTSASILLSVNSSNQNGNLVVELNGQELYNKNVGPGQVLIPIDKTLITTNNSVTIRSTGPSPFLFWQSSDYRLSDANFVINYAQTNGMISTFNLTSTEVSNFDHLMFQARVSEYSTPLQPLFIKVNNQIVYTDRPPLATFNVAFARDLFGNRLVVGNQNTISFSFEQQAYINLKDALIVVYSS